MPIGIANIECIPHRRCAGLALSKTIPGFERERDLPLREVENTPHTGAGEFVIRVVVVRATVQEVDSAARHEVHGSGPIRHNLSRETSRCERWAYDRPV